MLASLMRLSATLAIPLAVAGTAAAQYETDAQPAGLMLFTGEDFRGEVREVFEPVSTLHDYYFNDRAQSVAVLSGAWELCEHSDFTGRCVFIRGDVQDLGWYGLDRDLTSVRPIYEYTEAEHGLMFTRDRSGYIRYADNARYGYDNYSYGYATSTQINVYHYGYSPHYRSYGYYNPGLGHGPYGFGWTRYGANPNYGRHHRHYSTRHKPLKGHYGARNGAVTLYTDSYERGASLGLNQGISDLSRYRFNDNVSSLRINSGKWEVCEHANFRGRCQIVDASTSRLNGLRLNDNISSIRPVGDVPRGDRGGRGDRPGDGRYDGRNGRGEGDRGDRGGRRGGNVQGVRTSDPNALAGGPRGTDTRQIRRPHNAAPVRAPQKANVGSPPQPRSNVRNVQPDRRDVQRPDTNRARQNATPRRQNTTPRTRVETERRPTTTPRRPQRVDMGSRPKALQNAQPRRQERPRVQQQTRPRPQQRQQVRQPAVQQTRPQRQARPQVQRQPQRAAPQQRSQPRPQPKPQPRPQQQQRSNNMPKALRNRGGGEVHKN